MFMNSCTTWYKTEICCLCVSLETSVARFCFGAMLGCEEEVVREFVDVVECNVSRDGVYYKRAKVLWWYHTFVAAKYYFKEQN